MARHHSGVGPKHPQVLVLVGATGDLAQRKLWPGLFHLVTPASSPPAGSIGVSLDAIDVDGFREARARRAGKVLAAQGERGATGPHSPQLLDYVPIAAGAEALARRGERAEDGARRRNAGACIISACRRTRRCRRCGCSPRRA